MMLLNCCNNWDPNSQIFGFRRQRELEEKLIEEEVAKRVEALVAQRVQEELERRKDEIEEEVRRRVDEAKAEMERQMMAELEKQRLAEEMKRRQQEVGTSFYYTNKDRTRQVCRRPLFFGFAFVIASNDMHQYVSKLQLDFCAYAAELPRLSAHDPYLAAPGSSRQK